MTYFLPRRLFLGAIAGRFVISCQSENAGFGSAAEHTTTTTAPPRFAANGSLCTADLTTRAGIDACSELPGVAPEKVVARTPRPALAIQRTNPSSIDISEFWSLPDQTSVVDYVRRYQPERRRRFEKIFKPEMTKNTFLLDYLKNDEGFQDFTKFVLSLLNDEDYGYKLLQDLETETVLTAWQLRETKPDLAAAFDSVLGVWEDRGGFRPVIDLENKFYSRDAFREVRLTGSMFRDPYFLHDPHHAQGHRVHMNLILRAYYEQRPPLIMQPYDFYQKIGQKEFDFFSCIFDANVFVNYTNPTFLGSSAFCDLLPGFGAWT